MNTKKRLQNRWNKPAAMENGYYVLLFQIKKGRKIIGNACTFCGCAANTNDDCQCPGARAARDYNKNLVGKVILID